MFIEEFLEIEMLSNRDVNFDNKISQATTPLTFPSVSFTECEIVIISSPVSASLKGDENASFPGLFIAFLYHSRVV